MRVSPPPRSAKPAVSRTPPHPPAYRRSPRQRSAAPRSSGSQTPSIPRERRTGHRAESTSETRLSHPLQSNTSSPSGCSSPSQPRQVEGPPRPSPCPESSRRSPPAQLFALHPHPQKTPARFGASQPAPPLDSRRRWAWVQLHEVSNRSARQVRPIRLREPGPRPSPPRTKAGRSPTTEPLFHEASLRCSSTSSGCRPCTGSPAVTAAPPSPSRGRCPVHHPKLCRHKHPALQAALAEHQVAHLNVRQRDALGPATSSSASPPSAQETRSRSSSSRTSA